MDGRVWRLVNEYLIVGYVRWKFRRKVKVGYIFFLRVKGGIVWREGVIEFFVICVIFVKG